MILNQYIKKEGISVSKFADKCKIPLPTMSKYYYGEKIPRQENMMKIYKQTEKKVTANDFYGIK
jgi:predicted transcriptional regulator|tara:strand:+ start:868 stop:1059 length:192 start_codon:yes stop_codon:yes gene_type:complete